MSDYESPLGLAQEVESLIKMPQHLCRQRGICCKVATFRGSLDLAGIEAQAQEPDGEMARDFLALFVPYASQAEVQAIAPEFVERVREKVSEKGEDPDKVGFFHCRYVQGDGRCGVHEDRPTGCRTYPTALGNTIYHPGCGYEQQGLQNWKRIKEILDMLGISLETI